MRVPFSIVKAGDQFSPKLSNEMDPVGGVDIWVMSSCDESDTWGIMMRKMTVKIDGQEKDAVPTWSVILSRDFAGFDSYEDLMAPYRIQNRLSPVELFSLADDEISNLMLTHAKS